MVAINQRLMRARKCMFTKFNKLGYLKLSQMKYDLKEI